MSHITAACLLLLLAQTFVYSITLFPTNNKRSQVIQVCSAWRMRHWPCIYNWVYHSSVTWKMFFHCLWFQHFQLTKYRFFLPESKHLLCMDVKQCLIYNMVEASDPTLPHTKQNTDTHTHACKYHTYTVCTLYYVITYIKNTHTVWRQPRKGTCVHKAKGD